MKFQSILTLSTIIVLFFCCQILYAAGGKGNVDQLGKKIYVWHFDEGGGEETKDATAGLVGKLNGDIDWTDGILGKAVQMDGTAGNAEYIEVAHSNEVDIDEAITMMVWVYLDELPVGPQENKKYHILQKYLLSADRTGAKVNLHITSTIPIILAIMFLLVV